MPSIAEEDTMSDYLLRDDAPISPETWAKVDDMVVTVAKKNLVGRKVLEIAGPLGWGVDVAPRFGFAVDDDAYVADAPAYIQLKEIAAEFTLKAQHLAMAEQTPYGLDLGAVAMATVKVVGAEDDLVVGGLIKAATKKADLGDWTAMGGPFAAVSRGIALLRKAGIDEPYALVLSPLKYAQLASLMQHGRRELAMVESIAKGGIHQYADMPDDQVLLIGAASWNADIVLGQDLVTAYLGNEGLDHRFRVFETVALRIKRSDCVCVLA